MGAATVVKNSGTSFNLTLPAEIAVEQPAGTDLTDGTASVNFGAEHVGSRKTKVFTIKNTGGTNLTGLGIVIDGTDAMDFTVTVNPTAPRERSEREHDVHRALCAHHSGVQERRSAPLQQ